MSAPTAMAPLTYSCANQQHEVVEVFGWMRKLLADGVPAADIAIAATSPGDYDDHVFAQSADSSLPVHFVTEIRALTTADGQAAAALAEVLAKGLSQERVRRLFALLRGSPALADIPPEWPNVPQSWTLLVEAKCELSPRLRHRSAIFELETWASSARLPRMLGVTTVR